MAWVAKVADVRVKADDLDNVYVDFWFYDDAVVDQKSGGPVVPFQKTLAFAASLSPADLREQTRNYLKAAQTLLAKRDQLLSFVGTVIS